MSRRSIGPRYWTGRALADARRLVVLAGLAAVLVAGLALGDTKAFGGSAQAAELQAPSEAPTVALSSSWFCAGATVSNGGSPPLAHS